MQRRIGVVVSLAAILVALVMGFAVGAFATSEQGDSLLTAEDCPAATKAFEAAGVEAPDAYAECPKPADFDQTIGEMRTALERQADALERQAASEARSDEPAP